MIPERVGCRACGKPCLPGAYRCEACSKPHAPAADGSRLFDRPQAAPAGLVTVSAMGGLETYTGPPAPADSSAFEVRMGYDAALVETPPDPRETTAMTVDQVAALNALEGAEGPVPPAAPPSTEHQAPSPGHQAPAPYDTIRWEPGMDEFVDAVLRGEASPYVNLPVDDLDEVGDKRRLTCLSGGLSVPPGTHVAPPPVDPVVALGGLLRERLPAILHLVGCAVDPIRAARVAQGGAPQPDDPVRVVVRGRSLPGVAPMVFDAEVTRGDVTTYAELGGLETMADELVRSARVALQNEGELMRRDDVTWLAASKGLRILTPGGAQ